MKWKLENLINETFEQVKAILEKSSTTVDGFDVTLYARIKLSVCYLLLGECHEWTLTKYRRK